MSKRANGNTDFKTAFSKYVANLKLGSGLKQVLKLISADFILSTVYTFDDLDKRVRGFICLSSEFDSDEEAKEYLRVHDRTLNKSLRLMNGRDCSLLTFEDLAGALKYDRIKKAWEKDTQEIKQMFN